MSLVQAVSYQQLIEGIPTMTEAIERGLLLGGLTPKEAAFLLQIDYGHFVRMMRPHDNRHFPPDLIARAMEIAGNDLPLDWLAWRRGRATYPLEFMTILSGIKDALTADGRDVRFALRQVMRDRP